MRERGRGCRHDDAAASVRTVKTVVPKHSGSSRISPKQRIATTDNRRKLLLGECRAHGVL